MLNEFGSLLKVGSNDEGLHAHIYIRKILTMRDSSATSIASLSMCWIDWILVTEFLKIKTVSSNMYMCVICWREKKPLYVIWDSGWSCFLRFLIFSTIYVLFFELIESMNDQSHIG